MHITVIRYAIFYGAGDAVWSLALFLYLAEISKNLEVQNYEE